MTRSKGFDGGLALRAGAVQLVSVGVLFAILALALPHSFFEDWGVVAGPLVWIACSALVARVLDLPLLPTLGVAAVAGLLGGGLGQLIGHDVGIVVSIAAFAALAGAFLPRRSAG